MARHERTAKRLKTLQGKRISEKSLRRELDKAVPGARWDAEKTGMGLILFHDADGMHIEITLSHSHGNLKNYVVERASVADAAWQGH